MVGPRNAVANRILGPIPAVSMVETEAGLVWRPAIVLARRMIARFDEPENGVEHLGIIDGERSGDLLSKVDREGLAERIQLSIRFPSLDPQRDLHCDDRRNERDQPSDDGLPAVERFEQCCEPRRDRDHAPALRSSIALPEEAAAVMAILIMSASTCR
jgi:hypothetical protein